MINDTLAAILFSVGFLVIHFLIPKEYPDTRNLAAWASVLMAFIAMFQVVAWLLGLIIRFFFL